MFLWKLFFINKQVINNKIKIANEHKYVENEKGFTEHVKIGASEKNAFS